MSWLDSISDFGSSLWGGSEEGDIFLPDSTSVSSGLDFDLDGDGSVGSLPDDLPASTSDIDSDTGSSVWGEMGDAMASPQFLTGLLSVGANYFTGREAMKQKEKELKRQQQADAMANLLALAKAKYGLMAGGGGGSGGGGGMSTSQQISTIGNVKAANSNALQALGQNVSGAYGRR